LVQSWLEAPEFGTPPHYDFCVRDRIACIAYIASPRPEIKDGAARIPGLLPSRGSRGWGVCVCNTSVSSRIPSSQKPWRSDTRNTARAAGIHFGYMNLYGTAFCAPGY